MRVTLAQLNPIVGDIAGNLELARRTFREHAAATDLVVFPEMFLVGYPAQDLLDRPSFISRAEAALDELAALTAEFPGVGLLIGAPLRNETRGERRLYNAALLYADGKCLQAQKKTLLPTYDVFDEGRYFQSADSVSVVSFKGETLGVSICEDAWTADELWPRGQIYARDPLANLAGLGATLLINISASPFAAGKERIRYKLLSEHARRHKTPLVVVNQVGGNDELIFDGQSMAFDSAGRPSLLLESFVETVTTIDANTPGDESVYKAPDRVKSIHDALVFGLKDYARKCGFTSAVVGLSGGLDSAVTLALATEVFGAEKMLALSMPSRYSSESSVTDAEALAANLGVECRRVSIDEIYQSYLDSLATSIDPGEIGVTQENLQARIRGNILMAFSNKYGYLCLATGNKSELAVGYCTLYGDMSGGLCVLADVPKTGVYELANYLNREREVIPQAIIHKAPSAELRPEQKDEDSLPPYEILDRILAGYIEEEKSITELIDQGFDSETVRWVVRSVNTNEYKRRQAAPGLRVTSKSFGMGRRMPIAAKAE